jgi:hypothetical protein
VLYSGRVEGPNSAEEWCIRTRKQIRQGVEAAMAAADAMKPADWSDFQCIQCGGWVVVRRASDLAGKWTAWARAAIKMTEAGDLAAAGAAS